MSTPLKVATPDPLAVTESVLVPSRVHVDVNVTWPLSVAPDTVRLNGVPAVWAPGVVNVGAAPAGSMPRRDTPASTSTDARPAPTTEPSLERPSRPTIAPLELLCITSPFSYYVNIRRQRRKPCLPLILTCAAAELLPIALQSRLLSTVTIYECSIVNAWMMSS